LSDALRRLDVPDDDPDLQEKAIGFSFLTPRHKDLTKVVVIRAGEALWVLIADVPVLVFSGTLSSRGRFHSAGEKPLSLRLSVRGGAACGVPRQLSIKFCD